MSAFNEQLEDIEHAVADFKRTQSIHGKFMKPMMQQRSNRGMKYGYSSTHTPSPLIQPFHSASPVQQPSYAHSPVHPPVYQQQSQLQPISPLVQQPMVSPFIKPVATSSVSSASSSGSTLSASSIEDILSPRFDPFAVKLPKSTDIADLNLSSAKHEEPSFGIKTNIWGNDMSVWG